MSNTNSISSEMDECISLNTLDILDNEESKFNVEIDCDDDVKKLIYDVEAKYECKIDEGGIKFTPPVYSQRYMIIEQLLKTPSWVNTIKKVVDFGCAELTFEVRHLKKCFGIEEIVAVDIDENLLSYYSCKLSPTTTDYLQPRSTPLTVKVYCGSIGQTHQVVADADAVIAIELIEHLYPVDLELLPFTVFGFIKPKIAIFTTPNADFNVLFTDSKGFRHWDHKFEWSREQFEDWANNLVLRYPDYSVTFQGIGPGPEGTEALGCCSQMAIFVKVNDAHIHSEEINIQDGNYKLIQEYEYPYYIDKRTQKEKLKDEINCFITRYKLLSRQYDEEGRREFNLPIKVIMERVKCFSKEKIKDILIENNWKIEVQENMCEVIVIPDSESEEEDSLSDDGSQDELPEAIATVHVSSEEDWDYDSSCVNKTDDAEDASVNYDDWDCTS